MTAISHCLLEADSLDTAQLRTLDESLFLSKWNTPHSLPFWKGGYRPSGLAKKWLAVRACKLNCRQNGEERILITPGPDTIVTRDHARQLLEALAGQRLSLEIAIYTTSCIIFGDFEFGDDVVSEAIWFVEMADLNQPTPEDMRKVIERLTR